MSRHTAVWQVVLRNAGDLHSLAADKGYDWQELHEKLREESLRLLIKYREFRPINQTHNARIDAVAYGQRVLSETVCSTTKRTLGHTYCVPERGTVNSAKSS